MAFVTVYTRTIKRRKGWNAGKTETVGCAYRTKSLSPAHRRIRESCPDAVTYEDPKQVITDFVQGFNLGTLPIVTGGRVVARAALDNADK
jgi:hypothetical protein